MNAQLGLQRCPIHHSWRMQFKQEGTQFMPLMRLVFLSAVRCIHIGARRSYEQILDTNIKWRLTLRRGGVRLWSRVRFALGDDEYKHNKDVMAR